MCNVYNNLVIDVILIDIKTFVMETIHICVMCVIVCLLSRVM
jgi:hypothetical protein